MSLQPHHRKKDAIRFKAQNANNTYIILGGLTPWGNEAVPPAVPTTQTDIGDKFGAVKATVKIVKELVGGIYKAKVPESTPGTFVVKEFAELTTSADVLAWSGAVYIFLSATVDNSLITGVTFFRKLGWTTDLVPVVGHESDAYLPSANVSSWGAIESLEYAPPQPVTNGAEQDFFQIYQY